MEGLGRIVADIREIAVVPYIPHGEREVVLEKEKMEIRKCLISIFLNVSCPYFSMSHVRISQCLMSTFLNVSCPYFLMIHCLILSN